MIEPVGGMCKERFNVDRHHRVIVVPISKTLCGPYSIRDNRYAAALRAFATRDSREMWTATLGPGSPVHHTVTPDATAILVDDSERLNVIDAHDGSTKGALLKFRFYPEDRAGSQGGGKKGQ